MRQGSCASLCCAYNVLSSMVQPGLLAIRCPRFWWTIAACLWGAHISECCPWGYWWLWCDHCSHCPWLIGTIHQGQGRLTNCSILVGIFHQQSSVAWCRGQPERVGCRRLMWHSPNRQETFAGLSRMYTFRESSRWSLFHPCLHLLSSSFGFPAAENVQEAVEYSIFWFCLDGSTRIWVVLSAG